MNRKTLDRLLASFGAVVAVVLLLAGALMTWAHSYVHDQVRNQLAAEKIFFPEKGSQSLSALPATDRAAMEKYAGQQMLTGAQAKTWADHYIAVHLRAMGGGQTYSQLSAKSLAAPNDTKLAGLVDTVFRGETLRGLLLNAYAFDTMGSVALIGAIGAYVGAALMALLAVLGFAHARRSHDRATGRAPALETINS